MMHIKQLSVFVENRRGKMSEIAESLAHSGIDIRALSLADTNEFGLLRMIVSKPDDAFTLLREAGMMVRVSEVVAIGMPDTPGEFSKVLRLVADAAIDLEYMYALASRKQGDAVIIMRLDQPGAGISALRKAGYRIISSEEIYNNPPDADVLL